MKRPKKLLILYAVIGTLYILFLWRIVPSGMSPDRIFTSILPFSALVFSITLFMMRRDAEEEEEWEALMVKYGSHETA